MMFGKIWSAFGIKSTEREIAVMDHGIERQHAIESEGAQAAIGQNATRVECPYNKETQSFEWNHWVYGCELAQAEKKIFDRNEISFCSTSSDVPILTLPVEEAIGGGKWKPQYYGVRNK